MATTPEQLARKLAPGVLLKLYELDLTPNGGSVLYFHDGIDPGTYSFIDGVSINGNVLWTSNTANFVTDDVGEPIVGTNIQPGTTIALRNTAQSINLSLPATAGGSGLSFTIPSRGANQIVFQGKTFTPYPIKAENFSWNTRGTAPRPTLTVSNIGSVCSALLRQYGDFVGCKLTVRQTFARYVQGGSEPDGTKEFTPLVFFVDRKSAENNTICSFELSTPWDAQGKMLPGRQILANYCPFTYRGTECGYTGVPKQNRNGSFFSLITNRGLYNSANSYSVGDYTYVMVGGIQQWWVKTGGGSHDPLIDGVSWWIDVCLKSLDDCKFHFGVDAALPFGGFPGANKLQG